MNVERWPVDRARARLLILHGRGEHAGRYASLAADLPGIECVAFDQRGFGKSGRPLRRFSEFLDDLDGMMQQEQPQFLLGHSFGAVVAIRWLQTRKQTIKGLVLSGPFLAMPEPLSGAKRMIVRMISALAPDKALPGSGKPGTRDTARWQAYLDDPLTVKASTARWVDEVLGAQPAALAGGITVPTLVLQGGADASTDPKVSRRFAESIGAEYREYPGCLHEVLNELDRDRVLADLRQWIDARLGTTS